VVNDASEDDSIDILNSYAKKYPHLKIFNLEQDLNFFTGKKFPLALGIKSAAYDVVLLSDADCKPAGPDWISGMVGRFGEKTGIVLGYGPYARGKSILNKLIRYDAFLTAFNYLSFAMAGMPYMGVGRNLAYRKELFYQAGGFTSHYRLPSGDDDLFINSVARRRNTRVEISKGTRTYSIAKNKFGNWLRQKKRHYTTANYYKKRFKFLLSLNFATRFLVILSFITLAILNYNFMISSAALGFLFLSHMLITGLSCGRLGEKDLIALSPFLEAVFLLLYPLVYLSNAFIKPDKWT